MTSLRRVAVAILGLGAFLGVGLLGAPPASAHPLGNFTVNRYSGLVLTPGSVRVTYVVDMAEIPTFQEMPSIDTDGDGSASTAERQAWADHEAPALLGGLRMTVDGGPVSLGVRDASMRFRAGQGGLPILYFEAHYTGSIPSAGSVEFRDSNYRDRIGWKEITVSANPGVAVIGSTVPSVSPSHELTAYPADLLSSPLDVRSATFSFAPGSSGASTAGSAAGPVVSGAPVASGGSFAALVRWRLTPVVLALSLALAFGFGALHALGPGHGKTVTAAYLVGRGARSRQAVAAGVAVSLMHTASVLALGLVALVLFHSFPGERVYPWLGLTTGVVAVGLGGAMLWIRFQARRRGEAGEHLHGHRHGHGEGHSHIHGEHGSTDAVVSRRSLAALAVSGGLLPSPTALVVLTGAIAYHRLGYGLSLIAAFSAGLATALIGVALVAMRARRLVADRLGTGVASALPIVSAAVIMGFGLFFVVRGVAQVG
jgi:nickel/cobalt exporter